MSTPVLKPFHESVVDALESAGINEFDQLCKLILITIIPKDHDKILAALERNKDEWNSHMFEKTKAHLLADKQEAEAKDAQRTRDKAGLPAVAATAAAA